MSFYTGNSLSVDQELALPVHLPLQHFLHFSCFCYLATRIQISPPKPFGDDAALMPTDFRSWLVRFTNWIELTDEQLTTHLTNKSKNCHLFQLLGEEGGRQFLKQPEMDGIEMVTHADFRMVVSNFFTGALTLPEQDMTFSCECSRCISQSMTMSLNSGCLHTTVNLGHWKRRTSLQL